MLRGSAWNTEGGRLPNACDASARKPVSTRPDCPGHAGSTRQLLRPQVGLGRSPQSPLRPPVVGLRNSHGTKNAISEGSLVLLSSFSAQNHARRPVSFSHKTANLSSEQPRPPEVRGKRCGLETLPWPPRRVTSVVPARPHPRTRSHAATSPQGIAASDTSSFSLQCWNMHD